MNARSHAPLALAAMLTTAAAAGAAPPRGAYDLSWYRIAAGGGTSTGGGWTLSGTAGQHEAGQLAGGDLTLVGGFWGPMAGPPPCYADCNRDGSLTAADFACFRQAFLAGCP